ncbi:Deoxyribodipyrimidine photo-lyase [Aspergillus sclerotialis]|uniref:Deoxyribodipyrimidine photo-lyase n=1 Tax=Aspergillus sclerotialis TaxID=2070753 RepID=A0A3A2ZDY2_9EURO|nr:Deoxyribodipyrimidine photo-lyase [Aspergillus sclerotialis]
MPPHKRKQSDAAMDDLSGTPKRGKLDSDRFHPNAHQVEEFGIVMRDFYPPEMSNERCESYNNGILERPIETLQKACEETMETRNSIKTNKAVVHWFKSDLRLHDNRALQRAYQVARDNNIPIIGLYILSPEDLTAHLLSAPRVDMTLRTLELLKRNLDEIDIPLYMETQYERKPIPKRVVDLCRRWGANHIFANLEYEVDELRREAKLVRLCAQNGINFEVVHDTCVVPPGLLTNQQGNQYAVYSPWYRAWVEFLKANPDYLEPVDEIGANPGDPRKHLKDLFDYMVPEPPKNKRLSDEDRERFRTLYPAGEYEALRRLEQFLEEKAQDYGQKRSMVAGEHTSILSPYFAIGALSARTAVAMARRANRNQLDRGEPGYRSWISEIAWRDFYKHVLVHWPFIW